MLNLLRRIYINLTVKKERDFSLGIPAIKRLKQELNRSNYIAVEEIYNGLSVNERSITIDTLSESELKQWAKVDSEHWLASLFAGVGYLISAWRIRTGALAKDVSHEQFMGFFEHLEIAEEHLLFAADKKPHEAEVYSHLIRNYLGLQSKEHAISSFENLTELAPNHIKGHLNMAVLLTPKWAGSWEELETFAAKYKHNEHSPALYVVFLHLIAEQFLDLAHEDQKKLTSLSKKFLPEVKEMYKKTNFSSLSKVENDYLRNYYAFTFLVLNHKFFKKEYKAIGKNLTVYPWLFITIDSHKDLQLLRYSF